VLRSSCGQAALNDNPSRIWGSHTLALFFLFFSSLMFSLLCLRRPSLWPSVWGRSLHPLTFSCRARLSLWLSPPASPFFSSSPDSAPSLIDYRLIFPEKPPDPLFFFFHPPVHPMFFFSFDTRESCFPLPPASSITFVSNHVSHGTHSSSPGRASDSVRVGW